MPICCQRHANGDTFIVSRRQLVVLDKDKKEIFNGVRNKFPQEGYQ
jgi:hypothetical protein